MKWEWYQERIAEFFRRIPGAEVEENIFVVGKSKEQRQLDARVSLPATVTLSEFIQVSVTIQIIVDAKDHGRPVDIGIVGEINDLRDDVGAHVAIIASPRGFTKGAMNRAPQVNVIPLRVTSDLLAMLDEIQVPSTYRCLGDCDSGIVAWDEQDPHCVLQLGICRQCGLVHVLCPDCGDIRGIAKSEIDLPLHCWGGCGKIYRVFPYMGHYGWEVLDQLDVLLLTAAFNNHSKRITKGKVGKIVAKTKWQYFTADEPTSALLGLELMDWTARDVYLRITPKGEKKVRDFILKAR